MRSLRRIVDWLLVREADPIFAGVVIDKAPAGLICGVNPGTKDSGPTPVIRSVGNRLQLRDDTSGRTGWATVSDDDFLRYQVGDTYPGT